MSPFLQLACELAIILLAAKAAGYIATRLNQPSVLGELLAGLLLGPSLLDIAHLPFIQSDTLSTTIGELGEMGVLLLMFIAGLELHLNELIRNTKVAALAGSLGVLFPVGFGWALGLLFGLDGNAALFLGLTLGATSVSISAQTLMEMKVLRSKVGLGLLGAAVFDDVLVILLLSGFLAVVEGNTNILSLLLILGRMVAFLGLSVAFGLWVLPKLAKLVARLPISQSVLSLALIIMLVYGVAAEVMGGMAAITGAFLAGLMFARSHEKESMEKGIHAISYGLFVPIFFVSIGMSVNLRSLELSALWLTLAIILTAVLTKFFGAGLGARLGGFNWRESWQLGAGMVSRGEVGLIVASVGIAQRLVTQSEFSAIVGMVLVSTLVTPPLLRVLFRKPKKAKVKNKEQNKPEKTKEESER
jgi:Kef-type K+ transport system membrane component KefB